MNDYSKLQELAKAATPGEWFVSSGGDMVVSHDSCETICTTDENLDMHDAKFIAAANPATVLELLAERDQLFGNSEQLKAENGRLRKLPTCWSEVLEQSEANDQLLDKVLELSADADRYRFIVDCPIRTMVALSRKATEAGFDLSAECDQLMSKIAARAK